MLTDLKVSSSARICVFCRAEINAKEDHVKLNFEGLEI